MRFVSTSPTLLSEPYKLIWERPAHAYVFPFEPNPDWSEFYATGPEILQYMQNFVNKYQLLPYIRLNSRIMSAVWDEDKGICRCLGNVVVTIALTQYR